MANPRCHACHEKIDGPAARAGVGYHEIVAGQTTPSGLRRPIERLVDKPAEAQSRSA